MKFYNALELAALKLHYTGCLICTQSFNYGS